MGDMHAFVHACDGGRSSGDVERIMRLVSCSFLLGILSPFTRLQVQIQEEFLSRARRPG